MTADRLKATLFLDERVSSVRGVSAARAAALQKLGINTVRDLLTHFPRRYIDLSAVATVAEAEIGKSFTISGTIHAIQLKRPKRIPLVEITLVDNTGTMMITCFRQPWLADQLHAGDAIAVSGKVEYNYGFKRMTNPFIEVLTDDSAGDGRIIPVHPATEKISTAWMRRFVANALEACTGLEDPLPLELRMRYRLYSRFCAFEAIHFPQSMDEFVQARRRLVFEELLLLELHLMQQGARARKNARAHAHVVDGPAQVSIRAALPFQLTGEQEQARAEILKVMAADAPANHMLLGDVGTGKTAVAAFALAAAADTGTQALMMAPTEVLATQYGQALGPLLDAAGVSWALLTGSTPAEERANILTRLASGDLSVLFGTHALLEPDVKPARCSLVIIDEQQRFGTDQRATLINKGDGAADVLSLTATPIPRSLALALYGDMTLSYIRQRPRNLAGTTTHVFGFEKRGDAYDIVRAELEAGHQAFVVCPLVGKPTPEAREEDDQEALTIDIETEGDFEEQENPDTHAALQEAEILRNKVFNGYTVAVLHGRMSSEDKAQTMDAFRAGDVDILVSTTVIEVGVDVPNATAMIIEDADRFGLAQLHQLRGRVGRGQHPGQLCLISRAKAQPALDRLAAMTRTEDGFELAEYDLSLRREGDILGNRQHGASILKLVNVIRDKAIIEEAHTQAAAIMAYDSELAEPEHKALALELARAFPQKAVKRSG
ncbi:MAG: ATP-dependent DNA helicase RecG [Eggerthellaceae bacterium]|nr:ATP-dependent DNA helicase RecG [Eggerthellaceae bacterium]